MITTNLLQIYLYPFKSVFQFQWAMLVLNMERSISKSTLVKHQRNYSHEVKIPWSVAVKKGLAPAPIQQVDADETGRDAGHQLRYEEGDDCHNCISHIDKGDIKWGTGYVWLPVIVKCPLVYFQFAMENTMYWDGKHYNMCVTGMKMVLGCISQS